MTYLRELATPRTVVVILFCASILAGCSGDDGSEESQQALVGNWQAGPGDLFSVIPQLDFLVLQLREDSSGVAVFREPDSKALACADLIYTQLSDQTVLIDVEPFADISAFLPENLTYVIEGETLVLGDSVGRSQAFTRLDEPPAGTMCRDFSDVSSVGEIEAAPSFDTGLIWDGFSLWFGAVGSPNEQLVAVNPSTGDIETNVALPSGTAGIHAFAGLRAWFRTTPPHVASLRDFADAEITTIDTELDLGHKLAIDAMAWDGTHLWMSGESDISGLNQLVQVDTSNNIVVNRYVFGAELNALTWDGSRFWALAAQGPSPVLQIDPNTLQVAGTYELPGYDAYFNDFVGIAAVDGELHVLIDRRTSEPRTATILRVTP